MPTENGPKFTEKLMLECVSNVTSAVILTSLGVTATWIGSWILGKDDSLRQFIPLLILAAGTLITPIWIVLFIVYRKRFEKGIVLEELAIFYHWKSPSEILYKRDYKIRVVRNGILRYTDRFGWTGKGKCVISSAAGGHRIERHPATTLYDYIDIHFERGYNKDDKLIVTGVRWDLDDLEGASRPFISRSINEPTKSLLFSVEHDPSQPIEHCIVEETLDVSSEDNIRAWQVPVVANRCEWMIKKPKFGRHYRMRWRLKNGNNNGHQTANTAKS